MYGICYSCQILMKLEFPQQIFEKNTQISHFIKIRPVGVVPCGRMDRRIDRHDEANSCFLRSRLQNDLCPGLVRPSLTIRHLVSTTVCRISTKFGVSYLRQDFEQA